MIKQELIHSHILVAIFCGWEPQKPTNTPIFGYAYPNGYLKLTEGDDLHLVSNDNILEELPYATDWNYLMAAWGIVHPMEEFPDEIAKNICDAIIAVDIDLAFKELVRGINTINDLKLQES